MLNDNLNGSEIQWIKDQLRDLLLRNFLESASVTIGRVRIGGTAILLIDSNGGLVIDGKLTGSGRFVWTGPAAFDGDVKITKTLDVTGTTKLNATVELFNDLLVKAGGKMTVEGSVPMIMGVTPLGTPGIQFGAATLSSNGAGVALASGSASVLAEPSAAGIRFGAIQLYVNSTGATVAARLDVTGAIAGQANMSAAGSFFNPGITSATASPNVYADSTGKYFKASSAARFKIYPQPMELPEALLDVPVMDWIDLGNAERFAAVYDLPRPFTEAQQLDFDGVNLARVPGAIAEDVEAAGGGAFVTYDTSGQIEGVAYDRLSLARTEILARKLEAAIARIDELERRLA